MTDREKICDLLTDVLGMSIGSKADHLIENGVTIQAWIPVTERLPEEHDSIFARYYGTKEWLPTMFRKVSNDVIVCIKYENGEKSVITMRIYDGEWRIRSIYQGEVTHWMPLPEPPKEGE